MNTSVNCCHNVQEMLFPITAKEREPAIPAPLNSILRMIDRLKKLKFFTKIERG
jgi:hypothetical protein